MTQMTEDQRKEFQKEAVNWLLERGYELGRDYPNLLAAVSFANDKSLELEIKRVEKETVEAGIYIEFAGQNCDDCVGWDTVDSRCSCGNRRVGWVTGDSHSFKKPEVYAQAD
jgi:hypothetical protein